MAEFIPAAKASFLDRFKRRYSAQEVDMYQKGAANNYGQTFELVEREFEKALDSDVVPEGFNGDADAWNQFRTQQKSNPATFFPDMTDVYKVLGKDKTNRFFAGSPLGRRLLENPDDPNSQIKNVDLEKTEEFVDPETGETRYAPAVDTYNVDESGKVSGRTNEITDDGKAQSETQKYGFNNLSKDEFNAMVETFRLEKLKEGGVYSESFVQGDELFRELSTDGSLDAALTGGRGEVVDTVKKVETLRKNLKDQGFTITDPEQIEQSNAAANQASADAMPNLEGTFSGAIVNPTNPAVIKANKIVTSYKRGDNINVEELAMGLSKGFRQTFTRNFAFDQRLADAARTRIAVLKKKKQENNGTLSKGDQQRLVRAEGQLERSLDSQERLVEKVKNNIENDTTRYEANVGGNLEELTKRLEDKTFALTVENLSPTGKAKAFTEQGTALTKFLTSKHIKTMGQDKVFVNQVLSAKPEALKAIQKNPTLMADLQNLSGPELNSKYLNSDGSVNEKLVYGSKLSKEAGDVLTKNISNKKVDELFTAINNGNQEKVQSILASVNISDEDQQKLLTEVQSTGGDYRSEGNINKKRKLYFATLGSLVPGSALFNTLTNPNNAISNMIETGMINNSGLDAMSKRASIASSQRTAENLSDLYKNYLNNFDNVKKDFDLNDDSTMGNIEDYFEKQSGNYNDMTNWIRSGSATRTDKTDYLSKTLGVLKDINQAQQPGFWKELFTLGFARGPNMNLFGTEIDIQISRDKTTNKINGLIIGDSVFSPAELRSQGFSQMVIDQLIAAGDDNTTTTQGN